MKTLFSLFILLLSLFGFELAAQVKYGVINQDSLLRLIPGYSVADSVYRTNKNELVSDRQKLVASINKRVREYDSLKGKMSPIMDTLRKIDIRERRENLARYDEYMPGYLKYDSMRVAAFQYELSEAYRSACIRVNCRTDSIPHSAYSIEVNLNKEVAAILKSNKFHSEPKRIGYVNRDSLLRLFPEYRERKDSSLGAVAPYHQWYWFELNDQRDVTDSISRAAIDSIYRVDSIFCAPYELKFQQAWEAEMKVRQVFYIYDVDDAKKIWTDPKVQFVNLNKEFADRLDH